MHYFLVFDHTLFRPACPLIQSAMGGSLGVATKFPVESWLTDPTDDMKLYSVGDILLQQIVDRVKEQLPVSKPSGKIHLVRK